MMSAGLLLTTSLLFSRSACSCRRRASMDWARKSRCQLGRARLPAPGLIVQVVGAERVAVHEQRAHSRDLHHGRVRQQPCGACSAKARADEEIPVAVHERNRHAAARQRGEPLGDPARQRVAGPGVELIVADPVLEQVAQHVERRARAAGSARNSKKRSMIAGRSPVRCRSEISSAAGTPSALRADDRRRLDHHRLARHVAAERSARPGRQTCAILLTTSMPDTTLPKTA